MLGAGGMEIKMCILFSEDYCLLMEETETQNVQHKHEFLNRLKLLFLPLYPTSWSRAFPLAQRSKVSFQSLFHLSTHLLSSVLIADTALV